MDKKTFGLLGLGAATAVCNYLKYCKYDGTRTFYYNGPITGTNDWWILKKGKWVLLRGSHFLSIYNQIYHNQLHMGMGPMFYYSTIHSPIL